MKTEELPIDCFKVRYDVRGTEEELTEAWNQYRGKYPNMEYGTHIRHREDGYIVIVRFKTREACHEACIHEVKEDPLGK